MKTYIQIVLTLCMAGVLFMQCSEGDFLYNTNQKHTIYFNKELREIEVKSFTFAYYTIKDTVMDIPVRYIGMPNNQVQKFNAKIVKDSIAPLAVEGEDYEFIKLEFNPNEVLTNLQIKLKRSSHLKDTTYGICIVFEENEFFKPMVGTSYKLIVSDGDLPEPTWWRMSKKKSHNRFLGKYYPEKYRMVLERFKAMEKKYPDFYKYAVENYGEFLEKIPSDAPGSVRNFYYFKYSAIWGRYIFKPVWEYFTNPENVLPDDDISLMEDPVYLYK